MASVERVSRQNFTENLNLATESGNPGVFAEVFPLQRLRIKNDCDELTESSVARMVNISRLLRVYNATVREIEFVNFLKAKATLSLN